MSSPDVTGQWQTAFWQVVRQVEHATPLRDAASTEHLGSWTKALTAVSVRTCESLGWRATAKGHRLELLPMAQCEYLSLDVMAFAAGKQRWIFPTAVIELENSRDPDRIAYSLWKVLCVRCDLRIVFCYRRSPVMASELIRQLQTEVVNAIGTPALLYLPGQTLVVVGSRSNVETFPYDYFKWWKLDHNTAKFGSM